MDEESQIDLSSLTVDEDGHDDELSTEEKSGDEDENSTDEGEDDDEYETSTDEDDNGVSDGGPPIHSADDLSSPPESILLDVHGYIDARKNATTAEACCSKGGAIKVTFWAARPPRVSCFTVHCDGVKPDIFPMVLAANDDLVLLQVNVRPSSDPCPTRRSTEYYIYQAAGDTPTLRLLVDPPAFAFARSNVGILRLRDGEFLIAAIRFVVVADTRGGQYDLHLFDSRTWTWTTRRMHVDRPVSFWISPTKVLGIGGERGSMAWVDLWQGMLFCDLLALDDDNTMLRYIPLPPSPSRKREGCSSSVRDIAVVQGRIKFFKMRFREKRHAITSTATLVSRYWKATAWEKTDPWQNWRKDCGLDIFKVPVDKSHPELPSHLHDMGKIHGCQPALSLQSGMSNHLRIQSSTA